MFCPVPGHRPEDGVLHLVGILVLVHQDFLIPGRHLGAQLRGATVWRHQQPQGQVLLVGEVRTVAPQLFPAVLLCEGLRQLQQGDHRRGHRPQVLHGLLPADIQQSVHPFLLVLGTFPHPLESHHGRLFAPAPGRGQPGEHHRVRRLSGPFPTLAFGQGIKRERCRQELFAVAPGEGLVSLRRRAALRSSPAQCPAFRRRPASNSRRMPSRQSCR